MEGKTTTTTAVVTIPATPMTWASGEATPTISRGRTTIFTATKTTKMNTTKKTRKSTSPTNRIPMDNKEMKRNHSRQRAFVSNKSPPTPLTTTFFRTTTITPTTTTTGIGTTTIFIPGATVPCTKTTSTRSTTSGFLPTFSARPFSSRCQSCIPITRRKPRICCFCPCPITSTKTSTRASFLTSVSTTETPVTRPKRSEECMSRTRS
mmetsp:Transcript_76090/g.154523  ORF Transcript_76090/g.154523 Transcript_76090/m.154523 type:complete len:207 (-) Transcript_76090:2836-3456(-)